MITGAEARDRWSRLAVLEAIHYNIIVCIIIIQNTLTSKGEAARLRGLCRGQLSCVRCSHMMTMLGTVGASRTSSLAVAFLFSFALLAATTATGAARAVADPARGNAARQITVGATAGALVALPFTAQALAQLVPQVAHLQTTKILAMSTDQVP